MRNHLINVSDSGLITIAGGKWTTYRQMAQETVDEAIARFGLKPGPRPPAASSASSQAPATVAAVPVTGECATAKLKLVGAHGFSKTLFISLIQSFGIEAEVAQHLAHNYGDRAWAVADLSEPTPSLRFPLRGARLAAPYPFIDGEVRYAVRHEYAQTAVDVLARRTRLAFLNVNAALEALPKVIDIMAQELQWSRRRAEREWRDTVQFLLSMGLPAARAGVTRSQVEAGLVGQWAREAIENGASLSRG